MHKKEDYKQRLLEILVLNDARLGNQWPPAAGLVSDLLRVE